MTKEWYKAHGYNMSINIDQAAIDRAERDVVDAYVRPILPNEEITLDEDVLKENVAHCIANLAYLLVMQRNVHITRSGAKEKTGPNSMSPDGWRILEECSATAALSIKQLRGMVGASACAKVTDICKIYFTTNFIHQ